MAGSNELIKQGGHPVIKFRIVEMIFDDFASNIVFDGFSNSIVTAFDSIGQTFDCIGNAGFHNQLQKRHIIKRRDLSRLISFNIGVNQMAHIGLIGFQINAFATGLTDYFTQLEIAVNIFPDTLDISRTVPC